jgi:hypothetical protein
MPLTLASVYLLFISIPMLQLVHLLTLLREECRLHLPLRRLGPKLPKLHLLLLVVAMRFLLVAA